MPCGRNNKGLFLTHATHPSQVGREALITLSHSGIQADGSSIWTHASMIAKAGKRDVADQHWLSNFCYQNLIWQK